MRAVVPAASTSAARACARRCRRRRARGRCPGRRRLRRRAAAAQAGLPGAEVVAAEEPGGWSRTPAAPTAAGTGAGRRRSGRSRWAASGRRRKVDRDIGLGWPASVPGGDARVEHRPGHGIGLGQRRDDAARGAGLRKPGRLVLKSTTGQVQRMQVEAHREPRQARRLRARGRSPPWRGAGSGAAGTRRGATGRRRDRAG